MHPPHFAKMRNPVGVLIFLLLLIPPLSYAATCPYNFTAALHLIPSDCSSNMSTSTSCCWFVFAAYMFASISYSNLTGAASLPSPSASACSSSFSSSLLRLKLVSPSLLSSSSCNLNYFSEHRPCNFPSVSAISSAVDLSTPISACIPNNYSCISCQNAVIAATFSLFKVSNSKEFVPCGMAATTGIWSGNAPSVPRFRSYALCMLQVLENVGDLSTQNLVPDSQAEKSTRSRSIKIAIGSAIAGLVSVSAIVFLVLRIKKRKDQEDGDRDGDRDPTVEIVSTLPTEGLYIFTKAELRTATNSYSDRMVLGEGGSGKVYLGKLPSGQYVAIKRIYKEKKLREFYKEVEILGKLRHQNLTMLVGYSVGRRDHALVYEYMAGGNLSHALFHGKLTWQQRVRIAADVAQGLVYLHEFPDGAVVHRDVKPTNVLLTEGGLVAKLSDFGVSRIVPSEGSHLSTDIQGTLGYVDPESFAAGHVSESSDVYSFGVVLLELISGMKAVVYTPSGGAESVVHMVRDVMANGDDDWTTIVDPNLGMEWDQCSVKEIFDLANNCVKPYKNERPKMTEVLGILKGVLANLEILLGGDEVSGPSTVAERSEEFLSPSTTSIPTTPSDHAMSL